MCSIEGLDAFTNNYNKNIFKKLNDGIEKIRKGSGERNLCPIFHKV